MNRSLIVIAASAVILITLFLGTDPAGLPAFMLIIPFILISSILFLGIRLMLRAFGVSGKKTVHIAIFCTAFPLLLLILQSLGQLTTRDVLTLSIIFLLGYFYISRTYFK